MSLVVLLIEVHEKFKQFVRQRGKCEGSIEKGYIVYDSFYYSIEYINKINHAPGVVILDNHWDEDKREGERLQMNRKRNMIKSKSLIFCHISTK